MQNIGEQAENFLRELLTIYFAQQKLIITITLIIFLASASFAFTATPIYSAQGAILVRAAETQRNLNALETEIRTFQVTEEDLRSERELLRSPSVIRGAIDRLAADHPSLENTPDWQKLRQHLKIDVIPGSRVINIELEGGDPDDTVKILDSILDEYIFRRARVLHPEGTGDFFSAQLEHFRDQLKQIEDKLTALAREIQTPNPIGEIEHNMLSVQDLEERMSALRADEAAIRERTRYLDQLLASDEIRLFSSLENSTIAELAVRLIELRTERGNMARHYEDGTRAVAAIDEQILGSVKQLRQEVSDYRERLNSDLAAITKQLQALDNRRSEIDQRNLDLQSYALKSNKLTQEAELLRESYATFFRRRQEAEINSKVDSTASMFYVSILNRAYTTGKPVFPNRPMLLLAGLVSGLMVGFSLGLTRDYFDHSLKNPHDLEKFSSLPPLFSISFVDQPRQHNGV